MNWDQSTEARFYELRQHELIGVLDDGEKAELASMYEFLEQTEADQLQVTFTKMQNELLAKQTKLQRLRDENRELASLQTQLELQMTCWKKLR